MGDPPLPPVWEWHVFFWKKIWFILHFRTFFGGSPMLKTVKHGSGIRVDPPPCFFKIPTFSRFFGGGASLNTMQFKRCNGWNWVCALIHNQLIHNQTIENSMIFESIFLDKDISIIGKICHENKDLEKSLAWSQNVPTFYWVRNHINTSTFALRRDKVLQINSPSFSTILCFWKPFIK